MTPETAGKVADVAHLYHMLPYMKAELERLLALVDVRAGADQTKGALTPERALEYMLERLTLRKMMRRFDANLREGQSVGVENAAEMENKS